MTSSIGEILAVAIINCRMQLEMVVKAASNMQLKVKLRVV
jgi:hypothetical protein